MYYMSLPFFLSSYSIKPALINCYHVLWRFLGVKVGLIFVQARPLLREGKCQALIDGRTMDSHDCHQLFWMSRLAGNCLNKDPQKRLNMSTVSLHHLVFMLSMTVKCGIKGYSILLFL